MPCFDNGVWGISETGQIKVLTEFEQIWGTLNDDEKFWRIRNSYFLYILYYILCT